MKKRLALGILGIILGGVFLFLTLKNVQFKESYAYIRNINLLWLLLAVVIYISAFVVRSIRWKYLLAPITNKKPKDLFNYLILGFFINAILPLRIGEFIRSAVTGRKMHVSRSGVLGTVVVERLFDGISFVTLFLVTINFLAFPAWIKNSLTSGGALFICGMIFLFFIGRHPRKADKLLSVIPLPAKIRERVRHLMNNFISGLKIFSDTKNLIRVYALSLAVWGIEAVVFLVLAMGFGMDINFFQVLFVMIVIGLGAILPTAPGNVGSVELFGVKSLSFLGIDVNLAFGFILVLHVLQLVTILSLGIRALFVEKITFHELIQIEKHDKI